MSIKVLLGSIAMGAMLMVSCCNGDSCKKDGEGSHCAKSDSTKCCKGDKDKCKKKEKCAEDCTKPCCAKEGEAHTCPADCQKPCCAKEEGAHHCDHADSIACTEACKIPVVDSTEVDEHAHSHKHEDGTEHEHAHDHNGDDTEHNHEH